MLLAAILLPAGQAVAQTADSTAPAHLVTPVEPPDAYPDDGTAGG